jgi:peptidyl-prolyl cis-trans isomerase SurA
MLRPSLAALAVLFVSGLVVSPAGVAQSGPARGRPAQEHRGSEGRKRAVPAPVIPATAPASSSGTAEDPGEQPKGELLDRVVAIINEGIVTESELDDEESAISKQLAQNNVKLPAPDVLRSQVLERLVMQQVELQRAERIGLKISDEQLNSAIGDIAKRNNMTLAQLPNALAAQGMDYALFRDATRKEMTMSLLRDREVRAKINITPRELDQFMERLKRLPGEDDEYDVADILIALPSEATQAQVDELAKKAQEVYERARNEDFARLAVAFSNSQTALDGGALGWRKGGNLPTDLAEAIVALKPGEVSKPIATANGFHIVKLNGVRRADGDPVQDQVHVRHILIKPDTLQDDATVRLKLAGVRQKILDGQDFAAFAASMSVDTGSAVNGGELDWQSPQAFVPEFANVVAGLKEGEISEPFRTQYGWHIVQLLGRRKIDTTEDTLRERAYRQLVASKEDEETETWLRHLRDDAYVETNL